MERDITPTLHGSRRILRRPLPSLLTRDGYRTTTSALHKSFYKGKLAPWNITPRVLQVTSEEFLNDEPLSVSVGSVSKHPCCVDHEHYLCGDEQSVCGRFTQNALQPATAVAFAHGIRTRFGDFKVCEESKNVGDAIPDFVGVYCAAANLQQLKDFDSNPVMRLVGEAKTPWNHDLSAFYDECNEGDQKNLRHALGQIASYMHRFKMRYGFLTTYDLTIFVQQAIPEGSSQSVLYFTKPIEFSSSPDSKAGTVSVRQCLYYLLSITKENGSFTAKNSFSFDNWVAVRAVDAPRTQSPITPYNNPYPKVDKLQSKSWSGNRLATNSALLKLQLHHWESEGFFTAVLQFLPNQIRGLGTDDQSVIINGKKIEVEVVDDDSDVAPHDTRPVQKTQARSETLDKHNAPRKPPQSIDSVNPFAARPARVVKLEKGSSLSRESAPLFNTLRDAGNPYRDTAETGRRSEVRRQSSSPETSSESGSEGRVPRGTEPREGNYPLRRDVNFPRSFHPSQSPSPMERSGRLPAPYHASEPLRSREENPFQHRPRQSPLGYPDPSKARSEMPPHAQVRQPEELNPAGRATREMPYRSAKDKGKGKVSSTEEREERPKPHTSYTNPRDSSTKEDSQGGKKSSGRDKPKKR